MSFEPDTREISTGISRRDILKSLGAAGLAAAGLRLLENSAFAAPAIETRVKGAALRALPFELADVQLLESPFLAARQRSGKYLLSLEPDRMLHQFRVNAGLQAKAAIYGGWESVKTWADIHCQGHVAGHYLSGCSLMYGATQEAAFKRRVDYIVSEMAACQEAGKSGLLCAFPEGPALFDTVLTGKKFTGVPWYTTHKIMAGLRDAYLYTDNAQALAVLTKFADWAAQATKPVDDAAFQKMLGAEHGGMNEVLADVYVLTGDAKYLDLSKRFCHRAVMDPLAQSRDTLDRLHANTQIPKFIGFGRLHEATGEEDYLAAAGFFWKTVVENRSFVTGGHGDGELFFPVADFGRHVNSAKTQETCNDYNMLKLTRLLFMLEPVTKYSDYYERTLYNQILSSQDPDSGMVTYFQGTRPGYMKIYCTPVDSFWCCTCTGMENHAKYGDSIYFRGSDPLSDELYVNLFIPSTLTWKERGLELTQTNHFPEEAKTKLQLKLAAATDLTLNIRHPAWCKAATVSINGAAAATSSQPGSYIALKRTWNTGDTIEIEFPMALAAVALPGSKDTIAFTYGPVVLAGALGNEGIAAGADHIINERTIGSVLNSPFEVPAIPGDPATITQKITPAGEPLAFAIPASGSATSVRLIPYYKIAHERYAIYWKLATA